MDSYLNNSKTFSTIWSANSWGSLPVIRPTLCGKEEIKQINGNCKKVIVISLTRICCNTIVWEIEIIGNLP